MRRMAIMATNAAMVLGKEAGGDEPARDCGSCWLRRNSPPMRDVAKADDGGAGVS